MKDKKFYFEVDELAKSCRPLIIVSAIVISIISSCISEIGTKGSIYNYFDVISFYLKTGNVIHLNQTNNIFSPKTDIFTLLGNIVFIGSYFILNMCVLKYKQNGKLSISDIFEVAKNNYFKTLIVSSIYCVLTYFISKILIVGIIIVLVLIYVFMYLPYLIILKPELNFKEYFIESYNLTNGHKFELLKNDLRYIVRIIGITFCGFIAGIIVISLSKSILSVVVFYILVVVALLYSILKYLPNLICSRALYFINHMDSLENRKTV